MNATFRRKSWLGSLSAIWLLATARPEFLPAAETAGAHALELVRQARLATAMNLRTAHGVGTFRTLNPRGEAIGDVDFEMWMAGDKYKLDLRYKRSVREETHCPRRFAVSDGNAIFITRYSDRLISSGCETDVFNESLAALDNGVFGSFRIHIARLQTTFASYATVPGKWEPRAEMLPDGRVIATCDVTKHYRCIMEASPEVAYHVTKMTDSPQFATFSADWKQQRDVWYLAGMTVEYHQRAEKIKRCELHFTEFEVNPEMPPETFTLASLDPCEGSRIVDRRPKGPPMIYRFNHRDADIQKGLDGMVAQLESLPPRYPGPGKPGLAVRWQIALIAANAVLLGLFVWSQYRARRGGPSEPAR